MKISKTILNTLILFAMTSALSCKQKDNNSPVAEVEMKSLTITSDSSGNFELILVNKIDTNENLKMIVRNFEAQILTVYTFKNKRPTPLTIDLVEDAISKFNYTIKSVLINGMINGVYIAEILCANNSNIFTLNSNAIDAVTLAAKVKCPIYVDTTLLNRQQTQ